MQLKDSSCISEINPNGDTALHIAARNGQNIVISTLLDRGGTAIQSLLDRGGIALVDLKNVHGMTALHIGADVDNNEVVKTLLDEGNANIDIENNFNYTALQLAIMNHAYEVALTLIERGAKVEKSLGEWGQQLLKLAAQRKNNAVIKILIQTGVSNFDILDSDGLTPLQWATKNGDESYVLSLFDNGAKIDYKVIDNIVKGKFGAKVFNQALKACTLKRYDEGIKQLLEKANIYSLSRAALGMILEGESVTNREKIIDHIHKKYKTEELVIEEIKKLVPTSSKLTECIEYARSKFHWSSDRFWTEFLISFTINVLLGFSLYFSDLVTDAWFTHDLIKQVTRNFTQEYMDCSKDFDHKFAHVSTLCPQLSGDCIHELRAVLRIGEDCINNQNRFEDSDSHEWMIAGIVSAIHCGLPIVFAVFIWLLDIARVVSKISSIMFLRNLCACVIPSKAENENEIMMLQFEERDHRNIDSGSQLDAEKPSIASKTPTLPIFTKLYACFLDYKQFLMYMKETSKRNISWNERLNEIKEKQEINQRVINLSMINEASLESGFQVKTFSTVF